MGDSATWGQCLVAVAGGELGAAFRDDPLKESGNAFVSVAGVEAYQDIPRQGAGRDLGNFLDLGKPELEKPLEVCGPVEALDFEPCPPRHRSMKGLDRAHGELLLASGGLMTLKSCRRQASWRERFLFPAQAWFPPEARETPPWATRRRPPLSRPPRPPPGYR